MTRILCVDNEKDNKILRKKTKWVKDFNHPEIIIMKQAMLEAVKNPNAAGVAATQVGYSWRVFVVQAEKDKPPIWVFNPIIVKFSKQITDKPEGCLSVPGKIGVVPRHSHIEALWQDERGRKMGAYDKDKNLIPKKFEGFVAQIWQHEVGHLNKILYIDFAKEIRDIETVENDLPEMVKNDIMKPKPQFLVEKINVR